MSKAERKYELATQISIAIAAGKLFFYHQALKRLRQKRPGKQATKRDEMVKRLLLEYVNKLPDKYFFVPPDTATSPKAVEDYLSKRFKDERVLEKALKDIESLLANRDPTLRDFAQQVSGD